MIIFSALIFALVISIDTLAAGFAYGTCNLMIPMHHLIIIDVICSFILGLALFLGYYISQYISTLTTQVLSFAILAAMGGYKLVVYVLKKTKEIPKTPHKIKWKETVVLGFALAVDGFAVGLGISIHSVSLAFCLAVIIFSLATDLIFFYLGNWLGKKIIKKTRLDLSWLSGVVLIVLGAIKLL